MSNDKAASVDKIVGALKNNKKTNSSDSTTDINQMISTFHRINSRISPNAHKFKALDFSDAAIYGKGDAAGKSTEDEKFRQFHQMRIFIQSGQTIKHGANDSEQTMIVCNLPERIQYSLESKWGAPIKFGDEGIFNLLMQVGSDKLDLNTPSGTLRASTLKIWQNTQPLTLDLQIPVIDDDKDVSGTNLVEALEILGSLVLPCKNDEFFYTPPPSPLNVKIDYTTLDPRKKSEARKLKLSTQNYARIMVQLGGILLIDNCIIENVSVEYPNTKAQIMHDYSGKKGPNYVGTTGQRYLHPLLAIVHIRVSTLEALTANTYSKMLWAKPQTGEGDYHANMSKITTGMHDATRWLLGIDDDNNGNQTTITP